MLSEEVKNNFQKLAKGKISKVSYNSGIVFYDAKCYLEDLGFEFEDEGLENRNGWQVDYWTSTTLNDKNYEISGGMYYGQFNIELEK